MSLRFSRRTALQALSALPGALALQGCSGSSEEEYEEDEGALSNQELLARYKKIVVLVMENRSFDHYFGHLSLPKSEGGEGRTDVNGFTSLAAHTNPDLNGNKIGIYKTDNYAIGDIDHEWDACHEQFGRGANNGFITAHQKDLENIATDPRIHPEQPKDGKRANCYGQKVDIDQNSRCGDLKEPMAFYTRKDTPVFHELLDEYVLCDNWFASVMGPTWPNRFYLHAGTSDGVKANSMLYGMGSAARNSIFGQVNAKARDLAKQFPNADPKRLCVNFFADVPLLPIMFPTGAGQLSWSFLPNFNYARIFDNARGVGADSLERFAGNIFGSSTPDGLLKFIEDARVNPTFETLARTGNLPPISYLEPPFQLAPCDDHPPHDILAGQAFVASVYKILKESPDWKDTLFIITYDEHGSFYDHVAPGKNTADSNAEFRQLGFRVPALVIGPGVKKGYVSKVQYEHCSVLSTMTNRFGLAPSNDRVRVAKDISDCIDGSTAGGARGNLQLQRVELSEARVLETARIAAGQGEIVKHVFGGHVPFEAKRVFTSDIFETFDRLGVANIRK